MPSRQIKDTPLRRGDREPTTFSALSGFGADDVVEVFAGQSVSKAPAEYPAGPNWSRTAVPQEPALGYDINAVEPVGTADEVAASLGAVALATEVKIPASDAVETGPQSNGREKK